MNDPVRWGFLSTAKINDKLLPGARASDRLEVVAVASRDGDRAKAYARERGIERAHGSYEALLADPEIDAVYIPLPNHLHAEWAIAAAGAGKHVLCEKPMAITSSQAREMIVAARRAGVKLMEAFMYRLHPLWVEVRRLLGDG
ncbi:MAG: Gfo/Idh/MocA family protein, partial [Gaiellaceae bacterium]